MKEKNVARMVWEDSGRVLQVAWTKNSAEQDRYERPRNDVRSAEVLNETETDNHSQRDTDAEVGHVLLCG